MKKTTPEEFLAHRFWTDLVSEEALETYIARQPQDELNERVLPALRKWHCCGYAILPAAVDAAMLDQMQQEIDYIRANHRSFELLIDGTEKHYRKKRLADLQPADLQDVGLKLCDLHTISPAAAAIAMNPVITRFLRHVFGAAPALLQSLTFNKSSEQAIHQDFSYVFGQREVAKLAACWVALEDIHADAGPLEYFTRSHLLEPQDFFNWGDRSVHVLAREDATNRAAEYLAHLKRQVLTKKWASEVFLPRKGDVLMWHGVLLHGGTAMKNPALTRKSYVCHYTTLTSHQLYPEQVADGHLFGRVPRRIEESQKPVDRRSGLRRFASRMKRAISA
jgi:phytanoyl-CoA hydroxylase